MPANLGTAYVTIMPSAKGISGSISNAISGEATSAGTVAGHNLVGSLKKVIAVAGIGKFFKDALDAGGALQQSFGGLDTIYGDAAAGMKDLAYEAAKAGISANSYAEQAVSFGASLKQAYGGDMVAAANAANTAILDMADNSAKMGTDITMIQNAYQGFAKQNYTMLDNLKLGYGGTKTEMQRLLADAEKLSGVHYDIENLGDVYQAIHVIQEEIGLTGVAAAEAEGTFTGSMQSMKAAWENLKANLATGGDVTESLMIVYQSARNFVLNNLLPMIGNVLKGLPTLITTALGQAFTDLPSLIDMVIGFLNDITNGLTQNSGVVTDGLVGIFNQALDSVMDIDWLGLGEAIINLITDGLLSLGTILFDTLRSIGHSAAEALKDVDWSALGQQLIEWLRQGLDSAQTLIVDGLSAIWDVAFELLQNVDWIGLGFTILETVAQGIWEMQTTFYETIFQIGQTAYEKFTEVDWVGLGQRTLESLVTGLTSYAQMIWDKFSEIGQTAWEWFKSIDWVGLGKQVLTAILTGIFTVALALYQGVKTVATSAWNTFKNTDWKALGRQVITSIAGAIAAAGSAVWNGLRNVATTAWNTFRNTDWISLGSNIINGIISGIGNAASRLYQSLRDCAKNALESAKNFLGIESPSKVFRDSIGRFIPLGIAAGIEEEQNAVTDAVKNIARSSVGAIDTTFAYDATVSGLNHGVAATNETTVNVYPSQGMNERDLADMVIKQLTRTQRQANAARGLA